jgi:hypothetical protein
MTRTPLFVLGLAPCVGPGLAIASADPAVVSQPR